MQLNHIMELHVRNFIRYSAYQFSQHGAYILASLCGFCCCLSAHRP